MAGEIIGARNNGKCGTGIAYNAKVGSKFQFTCIKVSLKNGYLHNEGTEVRNPRR